jgi:hypothetical protein
MNPENAAAVSGLRHEIGRLLGSSVLLELETKAKIHDHTQETTDTEELSRIVAFLREEKGYIVAFLSYLLRENRIPESVTDLMGDIRRDYRTYMAVMEAREQRIVTESWMLVTLEYL